MIVQSVRFPAIGRLIYVIQEIFLKIVLTVFLEVSSNIMFTYIKPSGIAKVVIMNCRQVNDDRVEVEFEVLSRTSTVLYLNTTCHIT